MQITPINKITPINNKSQDGQLNTRLPNIMAELKWNLQPIDAPINPELSPEAQQEIKTFVETFLADVKAHYKRNDTAPNETFRNFANLYVKQNGRFKSELNKQFEKQYKEQSSEFSELSLSSQILKYELQKYIKCRREITKLEELSNKMEEHKKTIKYRLLKCLHKVRDTEKYRLFNEAIHRLVRYSNRADVDKAVSQLTNDKARVFIEAALKKRNSSINKDLTFY
jgi:hypothetical protein